jgi:putative Holliday junction resolvase
VAGFIEQLAGVLPSVRIVKWDERYTSEMAVEKIKEAGPNRRWARRKGRVDTAAAAIILQEYLDAVASQEEN